MPGHQEQTLKNWGGLTASQGAGNFLKVDFAPVESVSFGMKVLTLLLFRRQGTGTLLLLSVDPKRGETDLCGLEGRYTSKVLKTGER